MSSRLIIDLSESSLVNSIINADLTSNETFVESFKGLYIQSSDSNESGCITYFNTSSPNYLRLSFTDKLENQVIGFSCRRPSNRFNYFEHDYSNSPVNEFIETGNPLDSIIYLQSMGGFVRKLI